MSERRGVSAAEKYAELLANGQERPRCACHGEEMKWNKDSSSHTRKGFWRCVVMARERSHEANREKVNERNRRWRKANPEKAREGQRIYYEANREKISEEKRRYREANLARLHEREQRWRKANPEKVRGSQRRYYEANREALLMKRRIHHKANPEKVAAANSARMFVGNMYLGSFRFTQTEVEAMLSGTSD